MGTVNFEFTHVILRGAIIRRVVVAAAAMVVLGAGAMALGRMVGWGSAMEAGLDGALVGAAGAVTIGLDGAVTGAGTGDATVEPSGDMKTVLVRLRNAGYIASGAVVGAAQAEIDEASAELEPSLDNLPGYHRLIRTMENFPMAIYEVDAEGEASLKASPLVKSVTENKLMEPLEALGGMISPIEAALDGSYADGFTDGVDNYDGAGQKIVVIDSGVNKNHVALAGRVAQEACFSLAGPIEGGVGSSACDGGYEVPLGATYSMFMAEGDNTALPCDKNYANCGHGTMVAAAAVMAPMSLEPEIGGLAVGTTFDTRGVASGAEVVAIKAGTLYVDADGKSFMPDLNSTIVALDYAYGLAAEDTSIAAVNLSSGPSEYAETLEECQNIDMYGDFNDLFGQFKAIGVAVFVAAGNDGDGANQNKIGAFGCVENAVAVAAATNDGAGLAQYSNNGELTDLLAPGGDDSVLALAGTFTLDTLDDVLWLPNGFENARVGYVQGTSFAAPMAAGAYAVLREKNPEAGVDELVDVMRSTGRAVTDMRAGYTVGAKPLIQLDAALAVEMSGVALNPGSGAGESELAAPVQPGDYVEPVADEALEAPSAEGGVMAAPRTGVNGVGEGGVQLAAIGMVFVVVAGLAAGKRFLR